MSILGDLISKMKTDDLVEQIRILTEQIFEQESPDMEWLKYRPLGANIFLSLQVPGSTKKEVGFLTLERETEDLYLVGYWSILKNELLRAQANEDEDIGRPRKKKVHEIADHRPEKILIQYAKLYKFYHGE